MSETLYTGLTIDVRRIPDASTEVDGNGNKQQVELPGFLEYGVNLDGHFQVLFRTKAPGTLADIARAKQAQADYQASQPVQTSDQGQQQQQPDQASGQPQQQSPPSQV